MSSSSKASGIACKRYANALIDLAEESKNLDAVAKDLEVLKGALESSADLESALSSPVSAKTSLSGIVDALSEKAKFQKITKNFLGVLIANRRMNALKGIVSAFEEALADRRGALNVDVKVAQDLSAAQKKELQDALSKAMNADVSVRVSVEPAIMGGMVVTARSRMIDHSVRRKLEKLRIALGVNANSNQAA